MCKSAKTPAVNPTKIQPAVNPTAHVAPIDVKVDTIWTGPICRTVYASVPLLLGLWYAGTISGLQLCCVVAFAAAIWVAVVSFVRFKWENPQIQYEEEELQEFRKLLEEYKQDLQNRGLGLSGLNEQQVEFYRANGFLFVPNFVNPELARALHKSTAMLKKYTFHWNFFEDFTFKTYNNSIDSQIVKEWYENGPLKWVTKECNESVIGEMNALKPGVTREAHETQESFMEREGRSPLEDEVHQMKRGDAKIENAMTEKEWERLSRSLRMNEEEEYRSRYGYLYEYFCKMQNSPSSTPSRFQRATTTGVRMLNELILGVIGANDGIGFHWDRGSYSQLNHEESAVSTWLQLSEEGPGMTILRIRDVSEKSWNEGLQGQNFEPGSAHAQAEVDAAGIPCPSTAGTLILFDRREIHRTTPINRDFPCPFGERVVSVARWLHPDARLSGGGSDAPLWATPNAMQAYMLGSRNYFMKPRNGTESLYSYSKKVPVEGQYPKLSDPEMEFITPEILHGKLPTRKEVTFEYTWLTLLNDFPTYYMSEFWQKWGGGKLTTCKEWFRLIKEFPLHSRQGGYTKKNKESKLQN